MKKGIPTPFRSIEEKFEQLAQHYFSELKRKKEGRLGFIY